MVLGQHAGQPGDVVALLGDHAASRGHVGREEGRERGVAAEDPEDPDALVAAERRPLAVDELLGPGDRRREADAVLRTGHVVVHRLGDGHDLDVSAGEDPGE